MSIASDLEKVRRLHLDQPQAKILVIDIESSPNLAYVWGLWKQNIGISMIEEPGEVMCFAAKWHGTNEMMYYSTFHDGQEDMIYAAWDLLNEADIVVHYNGKSYDIKHLNREFLLAGLTPPSPFYQVDLLQEVKKNFNFPSNKLDYVVQRLGIGAKVSHTGFQLWLDCMNGEGSVKENAWALMREYNMGDVTVTDDLYAYVLPWIKGHPTVFSIIEEEDMICPKDGSDQLIKTGAHKVGMFEYDRYICETCGTWYRSRTGKRIANLRGV